VDEPNSPADGPPGIETPGAKTNQIEHGAPAQIASRAASDLTRLIAQGRGPGLHLVATPIGNLGDITLRALAVLATANVVYAEDTRHSGRLLSHFGIKAKLRPYHEHNAERERPLILAALANGDSVALVSDAGTPLVSDPGYKLVRACLEAGHSVDSIPGPSAPLAALVASGLPTDTFLFAGFLPTKMHARKARIGELATLPCTLILFESPSRVAETLGDLAEGLGNRQAAVARELTKLNEEFVRNDLSGLATEFQGRDQIKGEIAIVIGPPMQSEPSDDEIEARLVEVLSELSLRDAAKAVAEDLGVPRKRVYELGLTLRRTTGDAN
jgi:16S rRNA (cytidine1402-2'-O)-methyltransferase